MAHGADAAAAAVIIRGLLFVACAVAIQVEITPSHGGISVGDSKFFVCEVLGDVKDIDWFAPSGEKILPNRQDLFVSRSDDTTSTLTIYHATVDKAGNYKCVASNANEEAQATVQVKIFQKITFQSVPSPQEFNEGDNADIVCDVTSSPLPSIIWKYKGTRIQEEKDVRFSVLPNGHLQLRGIKKTDEGSYRCEARVITRGEIDFRTIKVVVNVLPTVRARQSEVNATADVGSSALLACDADGFPEPTVTWVHNNVVLEMGEKYSLNEDGSELVINDVTKLDEGEYTCIARNKAGEKSEELSLNVFVGAKVTYLGNQTASEFDEEVILTCEASGDPTPSISWSFENTVFSEGQQSHDRSIVVRSHARVSSLTLKNVLFTYAGEYLCTASNSIGQDSRGMFLEVRYAPKIQGAVVAYTWEGNPVNISCEVKAHPGAEVIWFRDTVELPDANVTNINIYNTPAVSYLEITPNSQNDFGSYNCTATNAMGTGSKEFLLIQAEVPTSPEILQVEPFSSTAVVEFTEPYSSGGVPVTKYKVEWRSNGQDWASMEYDAKEDLKTLTIENLMPDTDYEVKLAAINGKGEGESTSLWTFKTQPVHSSGLSFTKTPPPIAATTLALREPTAPKIEGKVLNQGNSYKVNWINQDDGGSPITHYLVRYKAKNNSVWKPELRIPQGSDYTHLNGLDWNTEYEVHVVAVNDQGKSKPALLSFRTTAEPTTIPDAAGGGSGLGTGAIVGILIVIFFLLLVGVDVTCYFLNKCGLLMCIAVNFCGKAGPGAKGKDMEEGKAAFTKDESKEPIVEVRTEEEQTPNQGGVVSTEPNETTPLTEPEPVTADATALVLSLPPPADAKSVSESVSIAPSSPATKSTTLASPSPQNSPTPEPPSLTTDGQPEVGPLVDLSDAPKDPPSSSAPPVSLRAASAYVPPNLVGTPGQEPQVDRPTEEAAQATSTESDTAAHNDGKAVKDENAKGGAEVQNATSEVKTVPNEAPQANGNESKA